MMPEVQPDLLVLNRDDVRALLGWDACMELVRRAMIDLSRGVTRQLPRHILPLGEGRALGVMAGGLAEGDGFGAKLISIFPENLHRNLPSHQGLVVLHDEATGAPVCIADAREITRIRTAAASAVATDALARPEAASLAILGYGEQAHAHAHAIMRVRPITEIRVWGRDRDRAERLAAQLRAETALEVRAAGSVAECVRDADIVCATTAAQDPILSGSDIAPGTHINLVGSSHAGPSEVDVPLVTNSRFIADSRENVLAQGAELRRAIEQGAVTEAHIVAEIGEVLGGQVRGRLSDSDITVYKSLGHIVQDMAAIRYLAGRARARNRGEHIRFSLT